jgi:hypothetical protein
MTGQGGQGAEPASTPAGERATPEPVRRLLALGLDLPDAPTGARRNRAAATLPEGDDLELETEPDEDREPDIGPEPFGPAPSPAPVPQRRTVAFAGTLLVLVAIGMVLAVSGWRVVRDSTVGQRIDPTTDPSAPGFEGFVEPSPTTLVVHRGPDGLASLALLALFSGDAGGTVLLVPPGTVVDPFGDARTLEEREATDGAAGVKRAVEAVLGIGIDEVTEVDDARWADLVGPVAPIAVANPDPAGDFAPGSLQLEADQVGPFLAARTTTESDLNRMVRHQLLWEAWIAGVARSQAPDPVPGERDAGLGRFVRGLAAGPVQVATLPVTEQDGDRFVPDFGAAQRLVGSMVPFPVAAEPGGRTRVRLLDGTGAPDVALAAAPLVVPAGAQIVLAGNDTSFGRAVTEVRYHHEDLRPAAEQLLAALGTGVAVADPRPTDTVDVTIVVGSDLAHALP